MHFQTESHRKPDPSRKKVMEIFSTFLEDIKIEYTKRCDMLTARIVALTKANKKVVSEITNLVGEVSTFMKEIQEQFLTKADFHHTLDCLEQDMISVQVRLSSPEWQQFSVLPELQCNEASGSTFEHSLSPPPPPPKSTTTQLFPTWAQVVRKPRKTVTTPAAKPSPAVANTQPTPKACSTKKGPTLRDRRPMVKRDGSPLTTSFIAIRNRINAVLNASLI
jgi:hypothetical protein